jgi:hypothetical protein
MDDSRPADVSDLDSDDSDFAEDPNDREDMIEQIASYQREFPELLTKSKRKGRETSSVRSRYGPTVPTDRVRRDLDDIKKEIASSNAIKSMGGLIISGAVGVQYLGSCAGLKLDGPRVSLAKYVQDNQEAFVGITKELLVKYKMTQYMEPEVRLGLLLANMIVGVHCVNSVAEEDLRPKSAGVAAATVPDAAVAPSESFPPPFKE